MDPANKATNVSVVGFTSRELSLILHDLGEQIVFRVEHTRRIS